VAPVRVSEFGSGDVPTLNRFGTVFPAMQEAGRNNTNTQPATKRQIKDAVATVLIENSVFSTLTSRHII
jgi:hypothetical protein